MTEPVVKEIVVPVEPAVAFRRFTTEMGTWWPLATHAIHPGESTDVVFPEHVGGLLEERTADGRTGEWGRVTAWEPPHRVAFTWYPGRTAETAQPVEVTFTAVAGGTRLRLVHSGWEILGDAAEETRAGYDEGWAPVLGSYAESLQVGV